MEGGRGRPAEAAIGKSEKVVSEALRQCSLPCFDI
jgi:hypothetical protein